MSISKGKRFEIFKRDGFACQYCGRRPPEVVLEVDHVDPRCVGGSDDEMNLVTSCSDCNRGKGGKRLGDVKPKPDADLEYLKAQQELGELQRYLKASKVADRARKQVIEYLQRTWSECVTDDYGPTQRQWLTWLAAHDAERVEYAVREMGRRFDRGQFGFGREGVEHGIRYASAIMNRVRTEADGRVQ